MTKRSIARVSALVSISCAICLALLACGKNYYIAGRTLPPSGVLNRVMFAEQNPNSLPFVDAYYDVRHNSGGTIAQFSISGYSGKLPTTIQNLPEEQAGAVYAQDGSFTLVSYATEKTSGPVGIAGGYSNSVFITQGLNYAYAANNANHVVSITERTTGREYTLNLPGVYGISVNPGGSIVLAFVQNGMQGASQSTAGNTSPLDFAVYSIVKLTTAESQAAANNPHYTYTDSNGNSNSAEDCEPQNLPAYCVFPVSTNASAKFDHPVKAVFSPDGTTAYVLNCGPECGGNYAGLTPIPLTDSSLNPGNVGASGVALTATSFVPIPGGSSNALFNGDTMYIAGQQCQNYVAGAPCSGLLGGFLSVYDTTAGQITGSYSISDGTHNKMVLADQNTLWVGSNYCNAGVRYQQAQAGASIPYGCLTMFNTGTNAVTIDAYKGDATGIAAVQGLNKVYSAEGGQVYIYSTANMSELDNSNVTVAGTVTDVAYMDAATDADNTDY